MSQTHRGARPLGGAGMFGAAQLLQRKANAVLEAAVDKVDRVAAPATPVRRPPDANAATPQPPSETATAAATPVGGGATDGPDLSRVPKSDVIALCVKTGRRLQAVEMQYAQLKAMHQVICLHSARSSMEGSVRHGQSVVLCAAWSRYRPHFAAWAETARNAPQPGLSVVRSPICALEACAGPPPRPPNALRAAPCPSLVSPPPYVAQSLLDERRAQFEQKKGGAGGARGAALSEADAGELERARAQLADALAERDRLGESAALSEEQHLLAVSRAQQLREAGARAEAHASILVGELREADANLEAAAHARAHADAARRREETRFLERVMALQAELATLRVSARKGSAGATASGAATTGAEGGAPGAPAAEPAQPAQPAPSGEVSSLLRQLAASEARCAELTTLHEERMEEAKRAAAEAHAREAAAARDAHAAIAELSASLKAERGAAASAAAKFHAQLSAVSAARAEAESARDALTRERDSLLATASQRVHDATAQMVRAPPTPHNPPPPCPSGQVPSR